jgi:hypothetical protein
MMFDGSDSRWNQESSLHFSGSIFLGSPVQRRAVKKKEIRSSVVLRCMT